MYISSLALNGFKSFGKKTLMTFGEGITGVVGPNGCGKTNIVDGLRWVLGEQKQSVLRSTRMEEIIFNGSKNRKPSGMCEVTLTIHNDKSKLPIEYTDVEITRRLYRDGESEYLVNRNPCRRKDIMDLFMDTGMGSDAYSVIELKMIEAILSDSGDDRRRMFEEAAGINKYRKQRASTHRKLDSTRSDLERVGDIITEVDSQVQALGRQLKRFERHKSMRTELRDLELNLASRQIQRLNKQRDPLEAALSGARRSQESEAQVISQDEIQLNELHQEFQIREKELAGSRQTLEVTTVSLNEVQQRLLVAREQLRATQEKVERMDRERESHASQVDTYQADLAQFEAEIQELLPTLDDRRAAYDAQRLEEAEVNEAFQTGEQRLQAAREKKFEHRQLINNESARRDRSSEIIVEKRDELGRLEESLQSLVAGRQQFEQSRTELTDGKIGLEARRSELATATHQVEQELAAITVQEQKLQNELARNNTTLQVFQSRLEIYSQMVQQHEGYPGGVRDVLDQRGEFAGLQGVVAGLIAVEQAQAVAVEAVLGPLATCLVVETETQARQLLGVARDRGFGRLAVLPMDRLGRLEKKRRIKLPRDFAGEPLAGLVTWSKEYGDLFERLFQDVYFISSDQFDGEELPPGITVVTTAGHLHGAISVLAHTGSSPEEADPSVLVGRTAEMERLRGEISRIATQVSDLEDQLSTSERQHLDITSKQAELGATADTLLQESNQLDSELTRIDFEMERHQRDLEGLRAQKPVITEAITDLEAVCSAFEKKIADLQGEESNLDKAIDESREQFENVRERRELWQEAHHELRVELVNLENQREKLAERKLSRQANLEATTEKIAQLVAECDQARLAIEELNRQLTEGAADVQDQTAAVAERKVDAEQREVAARDTRDEISRLEARIREQQHGREAALARQQELELNVIDLQKQEELIRARIQELFGVEVPEEIKADQPDEPSLRVRISKVQATLERIGPINMAVADEYEEEAKRLSFLSEQSDDLVAAEASLMETIRRIDGRAREQFRDTYDKIRYHFKQTFNLFFEGGEGDLRLIGDPDPLESGLEIIARPPGKKTSSLRSLSAGEKALTAIALLFAIYLVKPSPFCILDEVDAPLDDVNVAKFSRVIRQFARDTQFIIVTHNKLTMEQANFLYGVTMEESGLSRLVSVSLEGQAN